MKEIKINWVDIKTIKPYDKNPRKNNEAVAATANSIKEFGWQQPIVVDKDGVIIAGHTRLKAAKKLGLKTVPVKVAEDLTDEQARAYRLADNKTGELAEWDSELLSLELDGITDIDMSEFGFNLADEKEPNEVVEDEAPEVDEEHEPICQLGDIWQLGEHRLMCGDSTDKITIEKLLEGNFGKIDIVLTDPPYNVAYKGKTKDELEIENDAMEQEEFEGFLSSSFEIINETLKKGGAFYIWHASRSQREFENALNNVGLQVRQQLIWVKNSMVLGRQDYQWRHEPCFYGWKEGTHDWYSDRKQTTVLEFDRPTANKEHPTMKPISLIAYQIKNSTKKGDIVFDGFGGSGSTLIACEKTGRKCYTCEIDPKYCDVIIKRWENLTGQKAVKL